MIAQKNHVGSRRTSSQPVNPNLEFVLAGYGNPAAVPGAVPTPATARDSFAAMQRTARMYAHFAGARREDVWSEGLSLAMEAIGRSNLILNYWPHPRGVRPLVNTIIGRCVGRVARQQFALPGTLMEEEAVGEESDPASIAEAKELADMRLRIWKEEYEAANKRHRGSGKKSTEYVRLCRLRRRVQERLISLFGAP